MMERSMRALLFSGLSLLACGAAHAEDFTFNVPVEIRNLTHAASGRIICRVWEAQPGTSVQLREIAMGEAPIPISSGAYVGTVRVAFNARTGAGAPPAGAATHYTCSTDLRVRRPDTGETAGVSVTTFSGPTTANDPLLQREYLGRTGQALTTARAAFSGALPR
jgi:hypothetical protein